MLRKNYEMENNVLKETFNDPRKIKREIPHAERGIDEDSYNGGNLFEVEDGDLINMDVQVEDFDEKELAKYVGLAEKLYEKHQKKVGIYIICPEDVNVSVKEFPIPSKADFTIKLARVSIKPCHEILDLIKNKIRYGKILDKLDLFIVERLPLMCRKEDRDYFREESLKIINRYS